MPLIKARKGANATFRSLDKIRLHLDVPPRIEEEIEFISRRDRKPRNLVVTEMIARGAGLDPAEFGIEPTPTEPETA